MNKDQVVAAIVAAVAVAGLTTYELSDGTKYEVAADAVDCTYQPAGTRAPPCLGDGGFDAKSLGYLDAGCLAELCPRLAEVRATGKSAFFKVAADVKTKGTLVEAAPGVDAPADVSPVLEEKP